MRGIIPLAAFAALATAAPAEKRFSDFSPDGVYFPLKNGFPNPTEDELRYIERHGMGTLPNHGPEKISEEGIKSMQVLAYGGLIRVAFFNELYHNITNGEGIKEWDLGYGREYVLETIRAIISQEELHALSANGALKLMDKEEIQPCKYQFPVTDFQSAIRLATSITSLSIGMLQGVNERLAEHLDLDLVRIFSSVIANQGEQNGFFRLINSKRPTSSPFPTSASREWMFSMLESFTIRGSCPNDGTIKLMTYEPLTILSQDIQNKTQNIKYSFKKDDAHTEDWDSLRLVLINHQNEPVIKSLVDPKVEGDDLIFEAAFPFDEYLMYGLTVAIVTKHGGRFETIQAAQQATLFGPALIEIDYEIHS